MAAPGKLLLAGCILIFYTGFMFIYGPLLLSVATTFSNIGVGIGIEQAYLDFILMVCSWTPFILLGSLFVWFIMTPLSDEEDTTEMY